MGREVLRPDRYQCPECKQWFGEHMHTGTLSRHKAPGENPYDGCKGSLSSISGLLHQREGNLMPARDMGVQEELFPAEELRG